MTAAQIREAFAAELEDATPKEAAAIWREAARVAMAAAAACEEQYRHTVRLTVPGDIVKDLSPNRRICREARTSKTKSWRMKGWAAWVAAGRPMFVGPVRVEITIRRGRAVEDDNAVSSCKAIRDSLMRDPLKGRDSMLPADDKRHLEAYSVRQETGGRWRLRPEVEIVITGEKG